MEELGLNDRVRGGGGGKKDKRAQAKARKLKEENWQNELSDEDEKMDTMGQSSLGGSKSAGRSGASGKSKSNASNGKASVRLASSKTKKITATANGATVGSKSSRPLNSQSFNAEKIAVSDWSYPVRTAHQSIPLLSLARPQEASKCVDRVPCRCLPQEVGDSFRRSKSTRKLRSESETAMTGKGGIKSATFADMHHVKMAKASDTANKNGAWTSESIRSLLHEGPTELTVLASQSESKARSKGSGKTFLLGPTVQQRHNIYIQALRWFWY